ncbi:hypothetical protein RclHR1_00090048 [Rhizophagus clarus]|uniref:Uncharacterized protein n=1 Tax=Rhizophagus clarus TaxID=94130 RepID=A0A2Z6S2W7_9GLOM|nr:hypothetical protein RclHR1_00090048 [Rhizophagus clarus]GES90465.1 hypothetical protein GLOIN_2v1581837 [Rhizophagus clarus]
MKIKNIIILAVTFLIFQIININAQNILGSVIIPYKTVEIPPNNGTWYLCSQAPTKYVSYSVRIVNNTWPLTEPEFGTEKGGYNVPLLTAPNEGIVAQIVYTSSYKFVPSLSCYMNFVTECDQDAGNYLMKDNEVYCLELINPVSETQRANVTVSFTNSVFESPFTSDNKPGGNSPPGTTHNSATLLEFSFINLFSLLVIHMLVIGIL